jgi:hypothetical protein
VSHRSQEEEGEEPSKVVLPTRTFIRLALAALLGAGGGFAERRLGPASPPPAETLEHANQVVEFQLRIQRLEDKVSVLEKAQEKGEGRIGELEHQVRPASYRAPRP